MTSKTTKRGSVLELIMILLPLQLHLQEVGGIKWEKRDIKVINYTSPQMEDVAIVQELVCGKWNYKHLTMTPDWRY